MSAAPTRRVMLAATGSATVLLAGCQGIAILGPLPTLASDVRTLDDAITAEQELVASYEAAATSLSGDGAIAPVVTSLLAEHRAHLAQLRARLVLPPRLATARPRPSPTPPAMPSGRHRVITELAAAERAASNRLARQLLHVPPALAQLMASIGASEAAHVVVLASVRSR